MKINLAQHLKNAYNKKTLCAAFIDLQAITLAECYGMYGDTFEVAEQFNRGLQRNKVPKIWVAFATLHGNRQYTAQEFQREVHDTALDFQLVAPHPEDPVFNKDRCNAFTNPYLGKYLTTNNYDTTIVAGFFEDRCLTASIQGMLRHNPQSTIIVATDLTDINPENFSVTDNSEQIVYTTTQEINDALFSAPPPATLTYTMTL